jgi:hypothetical protein
MRVCASLLGMIATIGWSTRRKDDEPAHGKPVHCDLDDQLVIAPWVEGLAYLQCILLVSWYYCCLCCRRGYRESNAFTHTVV